MSATERQLVLNLAVADWRGGYRMPPSLDTARGGSSRPTSTAFPSTTASAGGGSP